MQNTKTLRDEYKRTAGYICEADPHWTMATLKAEVLHRATRFQGTLPERCMKALSDIEGEVFTPATPGAVAYKLMQARMMGEI